MRTNRTGGLITGGRSVVVSSFSLSLAIAEGTSRILLNPADYLSPDLIQDDILKHKIKPNSANPDEWGFRNRYIPLSSEIVAIGDSLTYGVSATAQNSWPS